MSAPQHTCSAAPDWTARLHAELRQVAAHYFRGEKAGHTLQPTALVHEVWLRFARGGDVAVQDRDSFMALAATSIRRILVDHARRVRTAKRGGLARTLSITDVPEGDLPKTPDILELDGALRELESIEPRSARVVQLRFFGGMQVEAIARLLGVSDRTVRKDWVMARAWLRQRLMDHEP